MKTWPTEVIRTLSADVLSDPEGSHELLERAASALLRDESSEPLAA